MTPVQPHIHCPNCNYILDGLPENRCPECGMPFDPAALREEVRQRDCENITGRARLIQQCNFREVVAVQVLFGVLFSLVLDGGQMLTIYLTVLIAHWSAVCIHVTRRSVFPRKTLALMRWGWIFLLPVGLVAGGITSCVLT